MSCATEEVRARQSTPIIKKRKGNPSLRCSEESASRTYVFQTASGAPVTCGERRGGAPPRPTASRGSRHGRRRGVGERHPGPWPSLRTLVPAVDLPWAPLSSQEDRQECCLPPEPPPPHTHTSCILNSTAENLVPGRPQRIWRPFGGGVALYIPPQHRGSRKTSQFCLGTEGSLVSTVNSKDAPTGPSKRRRVQPRVTVR